MVYPKPYLLNLRDYVGYQASGFILEARLLTVEGLQELIPVPIFELFTLA